MVVIFLSIGTISEKVEVILSSSEYVIIYLTYHVNFRLLPVFNIEIL